MNSEVELANLLYRYTEYIDTGDFAAAAALFTRAKIKIRGGRIIESAELLTIWERFIIRYPDGTPRTKHVISNPIIEVDESADTATIRSYYTVFQEGGGLLYPVVAGRYHDWFERADGVWRWSFRDYSLMDLVGDMTRHASGTTE